MKNRSSIHNNNSEKSSSEHVMKMKKDFSLHDRAKCLHNNRKKAVKTHFMRLGKKGEQKSFVGQMKM